ncbi:MAG: leucyl aminopeptidase [Anaerolineales bacterium]
MNDRLILDLLAPTDWKGALRVSFAPASDEMTSGQPGEVSLRLDEKRAVVSLGKADKINAEAVRKSGGLLLKWLEKHAIHSAGLEVASLAAAGLPEETAFQALTEGLLLAAFRFERYKSGAGAKPPIRISLLSAEAARLQTLVEKTRIVVEAVNLAREWAHEPANVINPVTLAERVQKLAIETGLKCTVLDDKRLAEMGAGAIVAVGKGSNTPARLILLEHAGEGSEKAPVVLVGKALTFDTGGYSLKSSEGIVGMKYDKCGAMAVIAVLAAAARLKLPLRLVGVIAAAENMISGGAYRPNDILKSLSGKTIEVISTDAEGRLVLADALAYAQQTYRPRLMIDIATLTGGVITALGSVRAGLMSNNDALAADLLAAGERTHERLWRLPLDEDYFEQIKGDDADIKNSGGSKASPVIGGMFLKQFVADETPWAHLDIAGMMNFDKDSAYCVKGASGFGVRLLLDYLSRLD